MNVGLVLPGFSANDDDWCIPALRHLARSIATQDDMRVIAVRYPYAAKRYQVDGADVMAIGGAVSTGLATLDVWRHTLSLLRDEHRRRPFDVLHAFWATESGLLAALAGKWLRIPTLVSLAGGELVRLPDIAYGDQRIAWERLKIQTSLRLASAVSVGSRHLQAIAQRHVANKPVHHAPLGVDLDLFSPPGALHTNRQPRVVHVGTLTTVKDQVTLLHAFARLRADSPGATLDIAGDGPLRAELQHLAGQLQLTDAVCWRGDVDHAHLPDVYRAASAFVLSSRHEAQGMVAIEAAACGLPVAGTCVGVIPEIAACQDAVAPVGAADSLAKSLAAALAEPEDSVRAASAQTRDIFGLQTCTDRFRALYLGLQ